MDYHEFIRDASYVGVGILTLGVIYGAGIEFKDWIKNREFRKQEREFRKLEKEIERLERERELRQ